MADKISCVYRILCKTNSKFYIGSTIDFNKRSKEHFRHLRNGYHSNSYLQRAYDKYGFGSFEITILEVVERNDLLIKTEQLWIDKTRCYIRNIGFNLSPTAYATTGYKYTEEQRNNCGAWKRPESMKRKLSEYRTGRKHKQETIDKYKESRSAAGNPMYGKNHSKESRKKISEARIKRGVGRGVNQNKAKLNDSAVKIIKNRLEYGDSVALIANDYGVHNTTIYRIRRNDIWTHVG